MSTNLGQKIRYFRKRKKISQLELENLLESSVGTISRIESGQVNPTKETIINIVKVLNLSKFESDYLLGISTVPVTRSEVSEMVNHLREKDYLSKKGIIGYVVDDRSRVWVASDDFIRLMGFTKEQVDLLTGKNMVEIVVDRSFGIRDKLAPEHYEDLLFHLLTRSFKWEMEFMVDDPTYFHALATVEADPVAKEVLKRVNSQEDYITSVNRRHVVFNIRGVNISLDYVVDHIPGFERFRMVQYIPTNPLIRFLSKL